MGLQTYTTSEALNKMIDTGQTVLEFVSASTNVSTDDATIKASAGEVFQIEVAMIGVTAGDKVEIKDDTTLKASFVASGTHHNFSLGNNIKIAFSSNITLDVTKSSGDVTVTTVYK